jgi:hypothetical protein
MNCYEIDQEAHIAIAQGGTLCGAKQTDSSVGRAHLPGLAHMVTCQACLAAYRKA